MLPSDGFEILHREVAAVRDRETLASPVTELVAQIGKHGA